MTPLTQVANSLHNEHVAVIALMERLEKAVSTPWDKVDPKTLARLLDDFLAALEFEIIPNFEFEEQSLFPILCDEGAGDLSDLLSDEHNVIRALGGEVRQAAKEVKENGLSADSWNAFRPPASEFGERLSAHASMEEVGLVPLLDDLIDADQAA
jgi:iron-sulfur cluster repair protein YtfE (RIC family)